MPVVVSVKIGGGFSVADIVFYCFVRFLKLIVTTYYPYIALYLSKLFLGIEYRYDKAT